MFPPQRMVRVSLAVAMVLFGLFASEAASAAPASIVINTLTPELQRAETGGGSTAELSFTNLTDGAAVLEVETTECKPNLSANQLPPNQITPVTLEFADACVHEGQKLNIIATLAHGAPQSFEVEPKGTPAEAPDWHELWAFLIALLLALVLSLPFYCCGWKPPDGVKRKLNQPLGSLDATWKFNDNWATNATAAGGLLSGLFGATTAQAFLGDKAEALTALATVGGAIALLLVAAAPIVVLATKSYKGPDGKRSDAFTVGGVLLGAVLVLAAAAGQLWVVAYTASELDLGSAGCLVWVGFGIGIAILGTYSFRSLKDLLERGTEPKATELDAEIKAAKLIVEAIKAATEQDSDRRKRIFDKLGKTIGAQEDRAGERYRRRHRSALL